MLWGSLFILKSGGGTLFIIMQQGGFMNSSQLSKTYISLSPISHVKVVLLVRAFLEAEPIGILQGKAAFMERSAEPNFNVWASVVSCPFLDLNAYP